MDYEKLLADVKNGAPIPTAVLRSVRRQLETQEFEGDPYTLLHILGKSSKPDLALVKPYLEFGADDSNDDGMVRRIALQVIGRMWSVPEAFEPASAMAFSDRSPYVRDTAARLIGYLGAHHCHLRPSAAALLIRGMRHPLDVNDREGFYYGMLEILEVPPTHWPLPSRQLNDGDFCPEYLAKVDALSQS